MVIVRALVSIVLSAAAFLSPVWAQDYPAQPIRLVVPYPPGGSTDFIARLYADKLSKELGQPIVVDNRPGASTNIGGDAVAKAKPDGYTVLFGGGTPTINSVFGPQPPFDPLKSLEPISMIARVPFVVAANTKAPFANVAELVSAAKAAPGRHSISSAQLHLYVELLKSRADIKLLHIPYRGGAQAAADAISGQVDAVFALVPVLLPHIQSGTLKAVGLSAKKRADVLPNTPTFVESGVDYDIGIWYGLMAPAGTPPAIVQRLAKATHAVVGSDEFAKKLGLSGAEAVFSQPAELAQQMRSELLGWQKLSKSVPSLAQALEQR
ncbi:Bug family tripartite tricarboxylate transporter substrate binding protein [Alicycliphilus sp. T452]